MDAIANVLLQLPSELGQIQYWVNQGLSPVHVKEKLGISQEIFNKDIKKIEKIEKTKYYENYSLSYSDLYYRVWKEKLDRKLSKRDFSYHLGRMVHEGLLHKERIQKNLVNSNYKIPPEYYSLTKKAKQEKQLAVLGVDEKTLRRRKLFQLIFFLEISKPTYEILSEKKFDNLLNEIGITREELHVEQTNKNPDRIMTWFDPIGAQNNILVLKEEYPKKNHIIYRYRLPGFSLTDILKKRKVDKKTLVVTSSRLVFDYLDLSRKEVEEAIESLLKVELIKPVMLFRGKTRYFIPDVPNEGFRETIEKCWVIHGDVTSILSYIWDYIRPPKKEEIDWMRQVYTEHDVKIMVADAFNSRKSFDKHPKKEGYMLAVNDCIRVFKNRINNEIVTEKYSKIIQKNGIFIDYLLELVYPTFLREEITKLHTT